ncbi:hypothetical protein [Paracoccus denitrificans]|jgi:hypothetical protein|uniref:hypothetical protein n=1 Tax=Paracoccus denitrificans TaxID=266 RepID=UPI000CEB926E|nr:hypothetical protein [Paracoccus denitrificans]
MPHIRCRSGGLWRVAELHQRAIEADHRLNHLYDAIEAGSINAGESENARVNAAGDVDDETFDRMVNDRWEVEKRLAQVPAENVKDVMLKIAAWTRFGECDLEADNPLLETLWSEARALVAA